MRMRVALSCLAAAAALGAAAGADEYVVFERAADLDGDGGLETVVVTGGEEAALRFATPAGTMRVPVDAAGKNYEAAYIVERSGEKHVALLFSYLPSNTELWVFRLRRGEPEQVFYFMVDWSIAVVPDGFEVTWKKYRDAEEGGYDLVRETYLWDANAGEYQPHK
jgi:hypothetical protein